MFRSFEIQNIMTRKEIIFVLILLLYGVVSSLSSQNELSEAYELSPSTITATRTERLEVKRRTQPSYFEHHLLSIHYDGRIKTQGSADCRTANRGSAIACPPYRRSHASGSAF